MGKNRKARKNVSTSRGKTLTITLAFVLFSFLIPFSIQTEVAEAYQVTPLPAKIMNPSFEDPIVTGAPGNNQVWVINDQIPYWVDDNGILLCANSFSIYPSDGLQFADFQKMSEGKTYQDISTPPGTNYTWSLDYLGNSGESMYLYVGAPDDETVTPIRIESEGPIWRRYVGSYQIPMDQPVTRIAFSATDEVEGLKAIDNLQFSTAPTAIETPKTVPIGATVMPSDLLRDPVDLDNIAGDPEPTFSFPSTEVNPEGTAPSTRLPGTYPTMVRVTDDEGHFTDYEVDLTVGSELVITEKFQNEVGVTIHADSETAVQEGGHYSKAALPITDYVYLGYKQIGDSEGETLHIGDPLLTNITASQTITFVYRSNEMPMTKDQQNPFLPVAFGLSAILLLVLRSKQKNDMI